jgi:predicted CopG family antitoxin
MSVFKRIAVREEVYSQILTDKAYFKAEQGGKWSISKVIEEYLKIIDTKREGDLNASKRHQA